MRGGSGRLSPKEILALDSEGADRLLERLEENVPVRPPLVEVPSALGSEAVVFGDTHGDWRSTLQVVARFLEAPRERILVGLGDYIDRPPADCGEGSVANALYLAQIAAEFPDRVILLQGNHETVRRIATLPHSLPEEVDLLWGPESERYDRILSLLERGPLAAVTSNQLYLAHAGFPRHLPAADWRQAFATIPEDTLLDLVWAEAAPSRARRGASEPFDELAFERFLAATGARLMLRGHDPDLTGRPVFHKRCLTLHTTRIYERFGGVILARAPLNMALSTTDSVVLEHLTTEGQRSVVAEE